MIKIIIPNSVNTTYFDILNPTVKKGGVKCCNEDPNLYHKTGSILGRLKNAIISKGYSKNLKNFFEHLIDSQFDSTTNTCKYPNLEKLLLGNPQELEDLKNKIIGQFSKKVKFKSLGKKKANDDHAKIMKIFGYDSFRESQKKAIWFINELKLKVCPYCNVNYILSIERVGNTKKVLCHLDHFLPKADYPFLSVSMYNLIPCCASCNHTKSDDSFKLINPYADSLHTKFTFQVEKKSDVDFRVNGLKDESLLKIKLSGDSVITEHDKAFGINSLYQHHKDIVAELYWKAHVYSDKYRQQLKNQFNIEEIKVESLKEVLSKLSHLKLKDEEINRFILGNYTEEKDFLKRPLSKLTHDIAKELGLIS